MTDETGSAFHLVLDGPLTLRTADGVFQTLRSALDTHAVVLVDATSATEVDLSFVQILLAGRKSARAAEKRLALRNPPDGDLLTLCERAGLPRDVSPDTTGSGGFWFAGMHS